MNTDESSNVRGAQRGAEETVRQPRPLFKSAKTAKREATRLGRGRRALAATPSEDETSVRASLI